MKTIVLYVYFLLSVFFVFFSCKEDKMNVIKLNIGTNNYSELILKIQVFGNNAMSPPNFIYFNGIRKGDFWTFCYPDSLYDKSLIFIIKGTTHTDTLSRYIGFEYICNKDTFNTNLLTFANEDNVVINATYLRTDTFPNTPEFDNNYNMVLKTVLKDFYLLTSFHDEELLSSIEVTKTGFYQYDLDSSKYNVVLDEYQDLVKKYPDSHYLIQVLNSNVLYFKSKNDIQKVFDYFSQDTKNSFFGKRMNQYLTDNHFNNSTLKAWDTGKSETIVIDATKYNLIIFSSSWCGPCIKEIPRLKEIYDDLSYKLDMTYVSIDYPVTVDEWRKLMRKENIPWRSVLAEEDIDYIIETLPPIIARLRAISTC